MEFASEAFDVVHHCLAVKDGDAPFRCQDAVPVVYVCDHEIAGRRHIEKSCSEHRVFETACVQSVCYLFFGWCCSFYERLADYSAEPAVFVRGILESESLDGHRAFREIGVVDGNAVKEPLHIGITAEVYRLVDFLRAAEEYPCFRSVEFRLVAEAFSFQVVFRSVAPAAVPYGPGIDYFLFPGVARFKDVLRFRSIWASFCSAESGCLDISATSFCKASEYFRWDSLIYFLFILN